MTGLFLFLAVGVATIVAQRDGGLVPFVMNHRVAAESRAAVSFLLSPPAGKDGFIRVQDSHFVRPNGQRIRFWGVNLTDWSKGSTMVPSKQDAARWAATLARFGVNCVRLHFLDLEAPRGLIDGTRNDSREFDPRLIELQKEYARKLLTHYNPYTKSEYRNEPAVAIVEIVNENALYVGFQAPTPYYDEALTDLYNDWLRETQAPDRLDSLRRLAGVPRGEPIPRLNREDVRAASKERFDVEVSFYTEMERRFFLDMQAYLKETLNVKSPIVGTADHAHSGSGYPLLMSTSLLDVVDGHTYWQHPGARGAHNTPMVSDPFNSTVVELSRTAFAGKPYTVSEVNHPYPSEWGSEGIPILAAYASFQDWDGVFWYTFEPKRSAGWQPYIPDPFDISHDPVKMPQLAAAALMFQRRDVQAARKPSSGRIPGRRSPTACVFRSQSAHISHLGFHSRCHSSTDHASARSTAHQRRRSTGSTPIRLCPTPGSSRGICRGIRRAG